MKKTIFLLAIFSITMVSCNNNVLPPPDKKMAMPSGFAEADSIPRVVAIDMIHHYLDTILVDHSLHAITKQASLYNSDLFKFFAINNITRIKLLAAAYLDTDSIVARRNKVTVLVQLKQGYHSDYYYYDIQTLGDGRICPPPYGCSDLIEN